MLWIEAVKQVGIRMSTKRPTQLDCLHELHTRIQQNHGDKCVAAEQAWDSASSEATSTKRSVDEGAVSRNVIDVLMLRVKLKSLEEHVVIVNKFVLEVEKEWDKLYFLINSSSFTRN